MSLGWPLPVKTKAGEGFAANSPACFRNRVEKGSSHHVITNCSPRKTPKFGA
jgi:hypothetical protein